MLTSFFMEVFHFVLLYCWIAAFAAILPLNPYLLSISFMLYLPTLGSIIEYAIRISTIAFTAIIDNFHFVFPGLVLFTTLYSWLDLFITTIPWDPVLIFVAFILNTRLQGDFLEACRILVIFLVAMVFMQLFPANPIIFGLVFTLNIRVQGNFLEPLRVVSIIGLMVMAAGPFQASFLDLLRIFVIIVLTFTATIPFL